MSKLRRFIFQQTIEPHDGRRRRRRLWLATSGGITRLRDQPFLGDGGAAGLPEDAVRIIFENKALDSWAGKWKKQAVSKMLDV